VQLDYLVNEAGVVYVGSAGDIRAHTLFAVYDLRDLIKKLRMKPENKEAAASELIERIVAALKEKVTPGIWSDIDKGPCSLTAYGQAMVIFAPTPVYRELGGAWKDLGK